MHAMCIYSRAIESFEASSFLKLTLLAENPKMIFLFHRRVFVARVLSPQKDTKRPFQTTIHLAADNVS